MAEEEVKIPLPDQPELTIQSVGQNSCYFIRHLEGLSSDEKEEAAETIEYAVKIGLASGISVFKWNPWAVFGNEGAATLVKNKGEINRRLFAYYHANRPAVPDSTSIMLEFRDKINEKYSTITTRKLESAKSSMRGYRRDADDYYNNYINKLSLAHSKSVEIMQLKGDNNGKLDVYPMIDAINSSFWQFLTMSGSCIDFITTQDVVIKEINKRAKINIVVNLGRLRARLDVIQGSILVLRFHKNIEAYDGDHMDFYHPHVADCGSICWGNAGSSAGKFLSEMKYDELFKLLASLLTTYSSNNPYAPISCFENGSEMDDPDDVNWDDLDENFVLLPKEDRERKQKERQEKERQRREAREKEEHENRERQKRNAEVQQTMEAMF